MKLYTILLASLLAMFRGSPSDKIIGEYWTEDKTGKIMIYQCNDKYCGRISWRLDNRKDVKNPDSAKRNRNVVGIQFLKDFAYDAAENIWSGGTVYSIDNGYTYNGRMWLENNGASLKMRGYIGFSFLGRTATLSRVK